MQEKTPPRSPRLIEARFQNRTDRNRVPDSNRSSKAVPGQEVWWIQTRAVREGFQEEENLVHGKRRSGDEEGCSGSGIEPILGN